MDVRPSLLDVLLEHGILVSMGVDGLYGRSTVFEAVIDGVDRMVTKAGLPDRPEVMRFPPAMPRTEFERSDYLKSFPQLAGTVHAFCGGDHEHRDLLTRLDRGEDWSASQKPTAVVLVPAACYPLYPMLAREGALSSKGRLFDVQSYCFRHEPSTDPARLQFFRMHEFVRVGSADDVQAFRNSWIDRAREFMAPLELPFDIVPASDAFFGRVGKLMKNNQREQGLKLELVIPVTNSQNPSACLSFNYHQDHFSQIWNLRQADGTLAHTGCVGFGLERLTLALFRHHGPDPGAWPASIREILWG